MYPRAINWGAEVAKGEYLLLCDADTCVLPRFHTALANALTTEGISIPAQDWRLPVELYVEK